MLDTGKAATPDMITLLTVTYGQREAYVAELLRTAFCEGVGAAVLVANGRNPALAELAKVYGSKVTFVQLAENFGSAKGYSEAIDAACKGRGRYFWLMDDDNAPEPGSLRRLLEVLVKLEAEYGSGRCGVVGYREDHMGDIGAGVPVDVAYPPFGSFLGFDVRILSYKVKRRLFGVRPVPLDLSAVVPIPYAPYGGLLTHRECIAAIGRPRDDFVLYGDDNELTFRIVERGGGIRLVRNAELRDQEGSWFVEEASANSKRRRNSFVRYLEDGADFRIYYSIRNRVWCDRNRFKGSEAFYWLNKTVFLAIISGIARKIGALDRYALIKRAIRDAEAGRLGRNPEFPLP